MKVRAIILLCTTLLISLMVPLGAAATAMPCPGSGPGDGAGDRAESAGAREYRAIIPAQVSPADLIQPQPSADAYVDELSPGSAYCAEPYL